MNLDDPLGFAFDDDGVWGLHVGGDGVFLTNGRRRERGVPLTSPCD
jgi:hypothetical protein